MGWCASGSADMRLRELCRREMGASDRKNGSLVCISAHPSPAKLSIRASILLFHLMCTSRCCSLPSAAPHKYMRIAQCGCDANEMKTRTKKRKTKSDSIYDSNKCQWKHLRPNNTKVNSIRICCFSQTSREKIPYSEKGNPENALQVSLHIVIDTMIQIAERRSHTTTTHLLPKTHETNKMQDNNISRSLHSPSLHSGLKSITISLPTFTLVSFSLQIHSFLHFYCYYYSAEI